MNDKLKKMPIWGGPRKMLVIDGEVKDVKLVNRMTKKISLTVEDSKRRIFNISDVWLKDNDGGLTIKGLWYDPDIYDGMEYLPNESSIAHLLRHYSCLSVNDIIGKEVDAFPDDRNYLIIVATQIQ